MNNSSNNSYPPKLQRLQLASLLLALVLVVANFTSSVSPDHGYLGLGSLQRAGFSSAEEHDLSPQARLLRSVQQVTAAAADASLHPLNYLNHPDEVVRVFQECTADPNCHFTYHHVSKTGGTTVEEAFFPHVEQETELTCCHGRILAKFRDDPERYCNQKFTSWQVSTNKFCEIVDTCNKLQPGRRTVVWVTFREPISTFVSLIHQMCNKNVYKRDDDKRIACEVCAYTNETAWAWNEYAQSVENQLKGAYLTSHRYLNATYNMETVVMEPNDLNAFWEHYSGRQLVHSNKQTSSSCSFKPTSELIKSFGTAQNVYRRMVAGQAVHTDMIMTNGIVPGRFGKSPRLTRLKAEQKKLAQQGQTSAGGDGGDKDADEEDEA